MAAIVIVVKEGEKAREGTVVVPPASTSWLRVSRHFISDYVSEGSDTFLRGSPMLLPNKLGCLKILARPRDDIHNPNRPFRR